MWERLVIISIYCNMVINSQVIVQKAPTSKSDFVESYLNATQKQEMLDAHNRFRSMVQPEAANMEYQVLDGMAIVRAYHKTLQKKRS